MNFEFLVIEISISLWKRKKKKRWSCCFQCLFHIES